LPTGSLNAKFTAPPSSHGPVGDALTKPKHNARISNYNSNCNAGHQCRQKTRQARLKLPLATGGASTMIRAA
jgi:hypothetical protein